MIILTQVDIAFVGLCGKPYSPYHFRGTMVSRVRQFLFGLKTHMGSFLLYLIQNLTFKDKKKRKGSPMKKTVHGRPRCWVIPLCIDI